MARIKHRALQVAHELGTLLWSNSTVLLQRSHQKV